MTLKAFAKALVLGLLMTCGIRSQVDPFAENPGAKKTTQQIRLQVEFIEMPHGTFIELMSAPRSSANDTDLRARCAELIKSDEARIIESLCGNSPPGLHSSIESISEFIYPTSLDPPELPNKTAPDTPPLPKPVWPPALTPTPAAFETRILGSTLEWEAQIMDHLQLPVVDLRINPRIEYHVGKHVWHTSGRDDVYLEFSTPRFYTLTTSTGTSVVAGQAHMIAALSPQDEKGSTDLSRKIMLFVRADILTTKP